MSWTPRARCSPPATGGARTASSAKTSPSAPTYREALENGNGRFFGIGTTRGEPGYYLASALTGDNGTLGVAVIKVSLEQLEKIVDHRRSAGAGRR